MRNTILNTLKTFFKKPVLAFAVIDLKDMDIVVDDYKVTERTEEYSGNWFEPAEPATANYIIEIITIEDLNSWEQEDIQDIYALKKGDKVNLNFMFKDDDGNLVDVNEEGIEVKEVSHNKELNEMTLTLKKLSAGWIGETPQQSETGRDIA